MPERNVAYSLRMRSRTLRPRRILMAALLATAVHAVNVARTSATQSQQKPPERGVELLAVDFAAVSGDGTPVTDLKAEEVTLRVGGSARPIRSLQLVATATAGDEVVVESLPPPFGSNTATEAGRAFALVIADDSFPPGRETPLREATDLFLKRLSPRDRVSLVTMPYGGIKVPFTNDLSRFRMALSKIVGRAPAVQDGSSLACESRRTLESLVGYLDTLGIRQEPATVMFVTAGLAAPRRDAPAMMAPGSASSRARCSTTLAWRQARHARSSTSSSRWICSTRGPRSAARKHRRRRLQGLRQSDRRDRAPGRRHRWQDAGAHGVCRTAFGRVLRERTAHYVAAITPERNDRSGVRSSSRSR